MYFFSGGGEYCNGGSGLELKLDGSEVGVDYELYMSGVSTGTILAGTGDTLNFGYQTDQATYSVTGFTINCETQMAGQPFIEILFPPGAPGTPTGPDVVCNDTITEYETTGALNASTHVWALDPPEAGTLTPNDLMVSIEWDVAFTGVATLSVYGSNMCDDGPATELEITVNAATMPEISSYRRSPSVCWIVSGSRIRLPGWAGMNLFRC